MPCFFSYALHKKIKFSIKEFFGKCDEMWWYLLKKSLMENFIFCPVYGFPGLNLILISVWSLDRHLHSNIKPTVARHIYIYIYIHISIYTYIYISTEGFLEVAIESWPEWDVNPGPLNSVQTL